jgi:hypothetical protein
MEPPDHLILVAGVSMEVWVDVAKAEHAITVWIIGGKSRLPVAKRCELVVGVGVLVQVRIGVVCFPLEPVLQQQAPPHVSERSSRLLVRELDALGRKGDRLVARPSCNWLPMTIVRLSQIGWHAGSVAGVQEIAFHDPGFSALAPGCPTAAHASGSGQRGTAGYRHSAARLSGHPVTPNEGGVLAGRRERSQGLHRRARELKAASAKFGVGGSVLMVELLDKL